MTRTLPPSRPRRAPDSQMHRHRNGAALVRRGNGPEVVLNPTALALWELCDGITHVEEMVQAVCELFAIAPAQAREDVRRALVDMRAAGVIA